MAWRCLQQVQGSAAIVYTLPLPPAQHVGPLGCLGNEYDHLNRDLSTAPELLLGFLSQQGLLTHAEKYCKPPSILGFGTCRVGTSLQGVIHSSAPRCSTEVV